jgi:hypothetical protein
MFRDKDISADDKIIELLNAGLARQPKLAMATQRMASCWMR